MMTPYEVRFVQITFQHLLFSIYVSLQHIYVWMQRIRQNHVPKSNCTKLTFAVTYLITFWNRPHLKAVQHAYYICICSKHFKENVPYADLGCSSIISMRQGEGAPKKYVLYGVIVPSLDIRKPLKSSMGESLNLKCLPPYQKCFNGTVHNICVDHTHPPFKLEWP